MQVHSACSPDLQISRMMHDGVCADYYRFAYHAASVLVRRHRAVGNMQIFVLACSPDLQLMPQ
jgi:hypothetical protein